MIRLKYLPLRVVLCAVALSGANAGCSSHVGTAEDEVAAVAQQAVGTLKSTSLRLSTKTQSCAGSQVQQVFRIKNVGSTAVSLSDIKIRLWANEATAKLVSNIYYGGCRTNANGCYGQVANVTATAVAFHPGCGPDANHQANWEITISTTDTSSLQPGETWDNVQSAVHREDWAEFGAGTGTWYSGCLAGGDYTEDNHFAVYYQDDLVYSSGINAPDCRAPKGTQVVPGHVPTAVTTAPLVGRVPAGTVLGLSIGLPARNAAELKALVKQVSDPSSAQYRKYIDDSAFVAQFGADPADFQALRTWAESSGLTITNTFDNSLLLGVSGTAAAINKALYVNLNYYLRPDGTQFYAPDREPSLDLLPAVLHISNLDNFVMARSAGTTPPNGHGPKGVYLPQDIRNAYAKCTTLQGTGQSLGVFLDGFGSDSIGYDAAKLKIDTDEYKRYSGITTLTPIVPCNVTGGNGQCNPQQPSTIIAQDSPAYGELALDVEMAMAMAPGLSEIVVFEGTIVESLKTLATRKPRVNQFSISYDLAIVHDPTAELALQQLAAQGQSVFISSGDWGPQTVSHYKATGSYDFALTVVGGTELQLDSNQTSYSSEVTWWDPVASPTQPGTGGGSITFSPLPTYQQGMAIVGGSTVNRNFPDVSMIAKSLFKVQNFDAANPQYYRSGGTSASAPLWAAFTALMNQANAQKGLPPYGFLNPMLYAIGRSASYSAYFNDVTSGTTGDTDNYAILSAGSKYDLATGWGSPKCELISRATSATPVNAEGKPLAAGQSHTCATRSDGSVACWGANTNGQLGNSLTTDSNVPVSANRPWPTNSTAKAVVAGAAHTCALVSDASKLTSVWCWGANGSGQLGNASTAESHVPVQVRLSAAEVLTNVTEIASGANHVCAVRSDKTAWCWGSNASGQLGNGLTQNSNIPVQVKMNASVPLPEISSIAGGSQHTCAVSNSAVYCWGSNSALQLGTTSIAQTSYSAVPVAVVGMTRVAGVSTDIWADFALNGVVAGDNHNCALFALQAWPTENEVWCWGNNSTGQVGFGASGSAVSVANLSGVCGPSTMASAGAKHTCSIMIPTQSCGSNCPPYLSVSCFGDDSTGQLGDGAADSSNQGPVAVSGLSNMTTLAIGGNHGCAANENGVSCWGQNDRGQIGNGTNTMMTTPALVQFY